MQYRYEPNPASSKATTAAPLGVTREQTGYPSPSDDYLEQMLNLNEYLVPNPAATFFMRVCGEAMARAGIYDGDLLVVDRSIQPRNGCIAVVVMNGELTVRILTVRDQQLYLRSANRAFRDVPVGDDEDVQIWGVCRYVIHTLETGSQ